MVLSSLDVGVRLDIRDAVLERAARAVIDDAGGRRVTNGENALVVADCAGSHHTLDVLLVAATPASCTDALAWVWRGEVRCAVRVDDVDHLGDALELVSRGWAGWWGGVAETARLMPPISSRQRAVLGGVVAGQSNATIGKHLHLSEATVKREVAALTASLETDSRAALVATAISLGVEPRPVRP